MRNLKRVLALALALVMMLGMMITASAASYSDAAAIDEDYADAVEVLSGMGIFKGTGAGFAPKQVLTRAEAAALVYRVITGDVSDKQIDLYDYTSFADVKEGEWYTGYITYAANGGYIKGYNGNAMPGDTVTGIQVLAMMLRAAGYGQNGEFEGAAWKDGILTVAKEEGIIDGISTNDLDKGATRELVAQLIFNAITEVKMVAYSPILNSYIPVNVAVDKDNNWGLKVTQTLGEKVFGLTEIKYVRDNWGRPAAVWTNGKAYNLTTGKNVYAVIEATPVATYNVATSECDIAKDMGLKDNATVSALTINGVDSIKNVANYFNKNAKIDLTAMGKVGAQGRLVEIYNTGNAATPVYEVVMIDQFLVKVTDVTEVEFDKNGHLKYEAALELLICGTDKKIVLESEDNWDYTKGEMQLIYWDVDGVVVGDKTVEYAEFLGTPDSLVGAQTAFSNKANTHIVEGTEYADAVQFLMDEAFKQISDHTWYFDTYGNLIGVEDIDTIYSYGVISAIKWYENDSVLEDGYAIANITYMDGTTEKATIAAIGDVDFTAGRNGLSEEASENTELVRKALYEIETTKKGLKLTVTEHLDGATTETGRPALNTEMNAGKTTQFLVYNNISKKYETYTGIANVPSYKSGDFWAFDKAINPVTPGDSVAEYVFINSPVAVDSVKEALYFIPGNLTITANMHPVLDKVNYYTITGGYVDGVKDALTVKPGDEINITDNAIYKALVANKGKLVGLIVENGYVIDVVHAEELGEVNFTKTYVDYIGAVNTDVALSNQGVLMTATQSYDVDSAELVSTVGNTLSGIFAADKIGRVDAYLYVVYTYDNEVPGNYTKVAKYIYATEVKDSDYEVTPEKTPEELYAEKMETVTKMVEDALAADPLVKQALIDAKNHVLGLDPAQMTGAQYAAFEEMIADLETAIAEVEADEALVAAQEAVQEAGDAYIDGTGWTDGRVDAAEAKLAELVEAATAATAADTVASFANSGASNPLWAAAYAQAMAAADAISDLTAYTVTNYSAEAAATLPVKADAETAIKACATAAEMAAIVTEYNAAVAAVPTYVEEQAAAKLTTAAGKVVNIEAVTLDAATIKTAIDTAIDDVSVTVAVTGVVAYADSATCTVTLSTDNAEDVVLKNVSIAKAEVV